MPTDIATFIPQLGLAGFAMFILWRMAIMFVEREERKDVAHAAERAKILDSHKEEREELIARLDKRDEAFRHLESDIRNTFSAALMESTNATKQAVAKITKKAKRS